MNAASPAPELSDPLNWLNCEPRRLLAEQGRVVALVFWHAGSACCQTLLGELQSLQRRHRGRLSMIAIHTPKFEAERDPRLVQQAVNALGLACPVAADNAFVTWQHYGVEAWPTTVLLDIAGHRVATFVGDLQRDAIEQAVHGLLQAGGPEHPADEVALSPRPEPVLPLAFPSGLAVGASHLYIADTGHHRVLECSLEGRVLREFGTGTPGLVDGNRDEACFQRPHGLFLSRDTLYVADTGNHALRTIRLLDGAVDTLAGNGRPSLLNGTASGRADTLPMNAPIGLTGNFDRLFIAMAGAQQLWEFNQGNRSLRALAGTGRLGLADGGPTDSWFAQPTSIVLGEQTLYVADAAASAIRSLHLPSGQVYTMVGQGLTEFGDQDGGRSVARMQYPTALAYDARHALLWIADTYNHCLRTLKAGGGELRRQSLSRPLHAPQALAMQGQTLWIANTNAHEVLRFEPGSGEVKHVPIGE